MKSNRILLLAALTMMTGCVSLSVPGGFAPVQGPLSKQSPIPIFNATMSGILSGTISVTLENGEVCKGPWAFVSTSAPVKGDTASGGAVSSDMAADWDTVYGTGYYVAHVLGNKLYARAALTGSRGTTIRVELSNEHNERGQTKGVAEDNNGNIFKVSVYN